MNDPIQEDINYSMQLFNNGVKTGRNMREIEICNMLMAELCEDKDCPATYTHAHCQLIADLLRRIKGLDREEA